MSGKPRESLCHHTLSIVRAVVQGLSLRHCNPIGHAFGASNPHFKDIARHREWLIPRPYVHIGRIGPNPSLSDVGAPRSVWVDRWCDLNLIDDPAITEPMIEEMFIVPFVAEQPSAIVVDYPIGTRGTTEEIPTRSY